MARPNGYPFAGGEWSSAYRLGRGPDYAAYSDSLIFDPAPVGGGTTHVATAAVMAFAGQSITSSAARLNVAAPASMAMAGQTVGSVNAIVHVAGAASMAMAGQVVTSIKAVVHGVASAIKGFSGQLLQSVTPVSHAAAPASAIYAGQEVGGSGVTASGPVQSARGFGKYFGYRRG